MILLGPGGLQGRGIDAQWESYVGEWGAEEQARLVDDRNATSLEFV